MRWVGHPAVEERAMNDLLKLVEERHSARVSPRGGLGFQALSALGSPLVEEAGKRLLAAPGPMKVAFAARLGHPVTSVPYPRVRREVAGFAHRTHFGNTCESTRR